MSSGTNQLVSRAPFQPVERPVVHCLTGREAVLRLSRSLVELSARCGQPGAMDDIAYFLSKPGALPRIPNLLLVARTSELDLKSPKLDDLLGAMLIFEQNIFGPDWALMRRTTDRDRAR